MDILILNNFHYFNFSKYLNRLRLRFMASTYPKKQTENTNDVDLLDVFSQLSTGNANKTAPKKPKLNLIKMLCIGEHNWYVVDFPARKVQTNFFSEILLKILRIERRQLQFGPICRVIGTDGNDIIQVYIFALYSTKWILCRLKAMENMPSD